MAAEQALYGLLAEFETPEALLAAVRKARSEGYRRLDAYSPYPVDGLADALGYRGNGVRWFALGGAVSGALVGYLMQVYANLDYPLNIGGRSVISPPAFLVTTFELTILFAVGAAVLGMLFLNGLPRLHHPLFEVERFREMTTDRFFLCIESRDGLFNRSTTADFLKSLHASSLDEVPA